MKKLLLSIVATVLTVLGLGGVATLSPVYAAGNVWCPSQNGYVEDLTKCSDYGSEGGSFNRNDLMSVINTVINIIIGMVGFIAVAVLIIGGINFITSQGDASKVTKARNTILYGVVGLVVALLAYAIVNFVLGSVFSA